MSQLPTEQALEEQFFPTNAALLRRWCPWLRLFRGFRMAIDYRRMLLALPAILLWSAGDMFLLQNFGGDTDPFALQSALGRSMIEWPGASQALNFDGLKTSRELLSHPATVIYYALSVSGEMLIPLRKMVSSAWGLIFPVASGAHWLYFALTTCWGLLICNLFGGAICRMAAVDFAAQQEMSALAALRFSARRLISYFGAPLIALIGLGVCWIPNLLAGLISWIPGIGMVLLSVFWFLPLISGGLMALIVAGVSAGWPLMIAAISAECSDAFDGLSRSYSYLFNQLWYAFGLVLLATVYGGLALFLVQLLLGLALQLTEISVGVSVTGLSDTNLPGVRVPMDMPEVAHSTFALWTYVVRAVPAGFVFSFFWTMTTLIYFLLRLRDDATPLSELAGVTPPASGLPIVGMPAATLREQELALHPKNEF